MSCKQIWPADRNMDSCERQRRAAIPFSVINQSLLPKAWPGSSSNNSCALNLRFRKRAEITITKAFRPVWSMEPLADLRSSEAPPEVANPVNTSVNRELAKTGAGSLCTSAGQRARPKISLPQAMLRLWNVVETSSLLCSSCSSFSSCSSCGFSFASDGFTLRFHRLHEIGRRRSFERQSIADFSHNALLQRLNKVDARVAARHFRSF